MHCYLESARALQPNLVEDLQQLVECESPSGASLELKKALDLLLRLTGDIAQGTYLSGPDGSQHLLIHFDLPCHDPSELIMGVGHIDTVWPVGALQTMPFLNCDTKLCGPGVLDMKGGLLLFCYAVRMLREMLITPRHRLALLVVSDEETGSAGSRSIIEEQALLSKAALVLEPGAGPAGKVKTRRKGTGRFCVQVTGIAAHAGVDFSSGANAIAELAAQVVQLSALTDGERGITVNAGVVEGGTTANIVPDFAKATFDVRFSDLGDGTKLEEAFSSLRPHDTRCSIQVTGGITRPPMRRTEASALLFARARSCAAELGIALEESSTGGASDGNFISAIGVPTLDGIGMVGGHAHSPGEFVDKDCIAERMALLALLLKGV